MQIDLSKKEAVDRAEKLRKTINDLRYRYHVLDDPNVTDATYDSLTHELKAIEEKYPELLTPDSPTQRIGGKPLDKFQKVAHLEPMLSLTDAFDKEELKAWEKRNQKLVDQKYEYFCELKMDGLAVSLIYENGIFVRGATRGDGKIGEDVIQNLKTIETIPLQINNNAAALLFKMSNSIEIRGEVYMSIKTFEKLNAEYKEKGLAQLANPRNAAAGSIRQLDPKISASRGLQFIAWDLFPHFGSAEEKVRTHQETHELLKSYGFPTLSDNKLCRNLDEVETFISEIDKKRQKLPYQIDGIVLVINNNKTRERLGVVGKAPRGMIAYKFAPEDATTIVEDIRVQVGRTGVLTPVAILKPVLIAGSTVSRATLHNEDEIKKKDVRIGDTVIVHKAGDVIPEVEKVLKELRTGKEKEFHFPEICPECGGKVIREEGFAAYRCQNKNCFIIKRRGIQHFVSKAAFDMAGLGPKIINKFLDEGLIKDAADLFNLEKGDIEPLERFAEKSAQNIVDSIKAHKSIELPRFIYALGIPNTGEETAYDISNTINSKFEIRSTKQILNILKSQKKENWENIPDIGPVVARSIYDYFHDENNIDFIERLFKAGVIIKFVSISEKRFVGRTFVFTGTLASITRNDAKDIVRKNGGEVSESVSSKTNYVVVGADPGSKYDDAKKLGIKVLSENEFLEFIK